MTAGLLAKIGQIAIYVAIYICTQNLPSLLNFTLLHMYNFNSSNTLIGYLNETFMTYLQIDKGAH